MCTNRQSGLMEFMRIRGQVVPDRVLAREEAVARGGGACYSQAQEERKSLRMVRTRSRNSMEKLDRITTDAARMNGEPCIRDLRLTVRRVLEALALYPDRAELKREYPELEDEDIRQALAYAD